MNMEGNIGDVFVVKIITTIHDLYLSTLNIFRNTKCENGSVNEVLQLFIERCHFGM